MKRLFFRVIPVFLLTAALFSGCAADTRPESDTPLTDSGNYTYFEEAYSLLTDKIDTDSDEICRVIDLLTANGLNGRIKYVIESREYGTDTVYYKIWTEDGGYSLYLENGSVSRLIAGTSLVYGDTDAENDPLSAPEEPIDRSMPSFPTDDETEPLEETTPAETETDPPETTANAEIEPETTSVVTPPAEIAILPETTVSPETEPLTERSDETTVPVQPKKNGTLTVVSFTDTVEKGSSATLTVKGAPETEFSIKVKYSSGYSSAAGLESRFSDKNGLVSWTWKVASQTKAGVYSVTVSDGDGKYEFPFTVTEKGGTDKSIPPQEETTAVPVPSDGYVLNTSTKKFHLPTCRYAQNLKEGNAQTIATRDECLALGGVPCKVCCP